MNDALYLLPDAALALVLARMRMVGLDRARPDVFAFLYAWLLYSLATLYTGEPLLHFAVWLFAAAPLARASLVLCRPDSSVTDRIGAGRLYMYLAMAVPIPSGLALRALGDATAELAAACIAASVTGGVFVCASRRAEHPDRVLWRGAGAYFLLLGVALPLPATFAPSLYPLLPLASAAVWLALAWFIAPTPDAIFNLEKLALSSMAPLRGVQGTVAPIHLIGVPHPDELHRGDLGRAGNVTATVLPVRNVPACRDARSRVGNPAGATTFSSTSRLSPNGGAIE